MFCDQQVPVRDGAYMARCQRAAAAVARAAAMLPDEWAYEVWAGKLAGKAGAPLSTVLRRCTRACCAHMAAGWPYSAAWYALDASTIWSGTFTLPFAW